MKDHADELMAAAEEMRRAWMDERIKMAKAVAALIDLMETEEKDRMLSRLPLEAHIEIERAVIVARHA